MTAEQYWELHKSEVLTALKEATGDEEFLTIHHRFWESLKTHILSTYAHEDILRQQIALLFIEADTAADVLRVREAPKVIFAQTPHEKPKGLRGIVCGYRPACITAVLGTVTGLITGGKVWFLTLLFAATFVLLLCQMKEKAIPETAEAGYAVGCSVNRQFLEHQMLRQVQLIDAHIADLKSLQNDLLAPAGDILPDKTSISLCQYVWATAHRGYPISSTLTMAEKLMQQNDMEWVMYQNDTRAFFDVMPTKRESRMVYPALRKASDGTLLCKGQYLQGR